MGDFARGYDQRVKGLASHFVWTNRSKESLTLDVKNPKAAAVLERLVILLPEDWTERRDRGLAYAELGHNEQAVADLQAYLTHADEALDSDVLMQRLSNLRNAQGE